MGKEKVYYKGEKITLYYYGTIFTLSYYHLDDYVKTGTFILAECYEKDYVFQIINIMGYDAGFIKGYIKKGILKDTHCAITHEELIEGIKYNFLNPDLDSLKIEDEYKVKFE